MSDKSKPHKSTNTKTNSVINEDEVKSDPQVIFDERFQLFTNELAKTCEQEGVKTAIIIVDDPQTPNTPIIFSRGSDFNVAQMMAFVLRNIKAQINEQLST